MATTKGAAGPSNFQSSENLILVCAAAGPPASAASASAAKTSPDRPSLRWRLAPVFPLLLSKEHAE
jgi:hypothetical protein